MGLDHGDLLVAIDRFMQDQPSSRLSQVLTDRLTLGLARRAFLQTLVRRADQRRPAEVGGPYRGSLMGYVRELELRLAQQIELNRTNCRNQNAALKQCERSVAQAEWKMRVCMVLGFIAFFMWAVTMMMVIVYPPC